MSWHTLWLVLLEQGICQFPDHVACCCCNMWPHMHNDVIYPAHPIIIWVFGVRYLRVNVTTSRFHSAWQCSSNALT